MDYLGKVYQFDREENFGEFLKSIGIPEEHVEKILKFKPKSQLVEADGKYKYISSTAEGSKETAFEPGVEFDESIMGLIPAKTTYTIEGNTLTQVVTNSKGTVTFKRDYSDDELIVTITSSMWDGVAYRYYKAE